MTLTLGMHRNKASSETISHTKGRGGIGKLHKQGLSSTQLQRKKMGNMTSDLTGHPGNRTEMEASQFVTFRYAVEDSGSCHGLADIIMHGKPIKMVIQGDSLDDFKSEAQYVITTYYKVTCILM